MPLNHPNNKSRNPCHYYFSLWIVAALFLRTSDAFYPAIHSKSSLKPWNMSPAATTTTGTAAEQETAIPNWRVIPSEADDYSHYLVDRAPWSEARWEEALALYDHLHNCTDSYVSPGIKDALNTLDHALRLYGPHSVLCSFNGGKDAVVILHLLRAAHAKYYKSTGETPIRPRVVYFEHENEFPEVIEFLKESVTQYDLEMLSFEQGVKFSQGLEILVQHNVLPGCSRTFPMAFVLGTRSSDPNAHGQDHFAPSSHYMPPFMRVNPVLNWSYGHVWHFLRLFHLPYCGLYDAGYTSLGTTKDTLPCPALAVITRAKDEDPATSALPKFWPAYMLRDWDQERAGRIQKEKKNPKKPVPHTSSTISAALQNSDHPSELLLAADDSTCFTMDSDYGSQKTVGILIIGDEILKGLTVDQNTNVAAKALRKESVILSRVVVVSDDQDEIVKDIQRLNSEVDVIITSGGVGPTHDDVTLKSVAAALGRDMVLHKEMADLLKEKMGSKDAELTDAQIKMATLPTNAKLRYLSDNEKDWPVLQCRNIFILPGVPEFFAQKIENLAAYLSSQLERSVAFKVVLSVDEASIVDVLNIAVMKHPNVSFGSYPFVSHPEFKTVLTLEGSLVDSEHPMSKAGARNSTFFLDSAACMLSKEDRDNYVRLALDDLITKLPDGSILRVENDDLTPFT
jgi:FAD synthetase